MLFFTRFFQFPLKWYHGFIFLILINFLTFSWVFVDLPYYKSLNKPFFAPPSWVFGPAWVTNNILVITGNIWALNLWFKIKKSFNIDKIDQNLAIKDSKINITNLVESNLENIHRDTKQKNQNVQTKLYILNQKETLKDLKSFFILQTLSWINYVIFSGLSFGLHNPSMFFWPTFSMWVLTIASIYFASQIDSDTSPKGFWQTVVQGRSIAFTFVTLLIWLTIAYILGFYIWIKN